ncbi:MAG TPA: hypothetical protein VFE06_07980 [Acidobacteriaceae bacterium]|jgi:hypothetical protein|nr:hypothetical protein [Acidobacteriaceae bacterium]
MAQPLKKADEFPRDADEARQARERIERQAPSETATHGMERAPGDVEVRPEPTRTSLSEDIRARIERPHKGDVGRPGTNEEIFQGSKQRELK